MMEDSCLELKGVAFRRHEKRHWKEAVSATLFGLGALVGMAGCAIYPMAVFTVGANDSPQEVWGISLVISYHFFRRAFWLCASDYWPVA